METNERRASVNKEDLFKLADEFLELNKTAPTQSYLREQLGGSFSTIGPMLREWREQAETTARAVLEMPDDVRDSALEMVGSWWQSIQSIVNDKIDAIQEKANNLVKVAQDEVGEYIDEIKRLESELSDVGSKLASLQLENDDLIKKGTSLIAALEQKEAGIADLKSTNTTLKDDNYTQKNLIIELEKQAAVDASNIEKALQSLTDKDKTHADLIIKADKEHAKQVAAIEKARDNQIETLVKSHTSAITVLEKTHDKAVASLDKANSATISQLKETMSLMAEEIKTLKAAKPSPAKKKIKLNT